MRENSRKTVTVKCHFCNNDVKKFKNEYDRKIRKGTKFYCNLSCASKDNPILVENAKLVKENPYESYKRLISSPNFKFKTKDELSPFRIYLNKVKQRLKSFHSDKELTIDEIYLKEVWDGQNGICPYTNLKMELRDYSNPSIPTSASLDRIDSSKGYIRGNIEFVCMSINFAKNDFSKDEIVKFIKQIKES